MTLYKTIWTLLKANKSNLLIGVIITVVATFFFAQNIDVDNTSLQDAKIALISEEESPVVDGLRKYLNDKETVVTLDGTSQKEIDDALYFNRVNIILHLPADFTEQVEVGKMATIKIQSRPDAFSKTVVTQQVNTFLQTLILFQEEDKTIDAAMEQTQMALSVTGEVELSAGYSQRMKKLLTGTTFNFLSYGLFLSIFSGFSVINLAFNRKEISKRNQSAPITKRNLNRKVTFSLISYSLLLFSGFLLLMVLLVIHTSWDITVWYHILNTFLFLLPIISFSACITSLVKNSETSGGIKDIFITGSCFIGGVFVPAEYLPEMVSKIAAFTPTYWFVQNNNLISETLSYNQTFAESFWFNGCVLVAFAAVFSMIQFILGKERNYRWQPNWAKN